MRQLFFRSDQQTAQEIAETARAVSQYSITDIRKEIGKEDFFKNFFFNLGFKVHLMKTDDVVSILVSFAQNTEFRDYKNTYGLWPILINVLKSRAESFTLENVTDVIHSLCLIRVGSSLSAELLKILNAQLDLYTTDELMSIPMSKLGNLTWAINLKKLGSLEFHKRLITSFLQNKDFAHTTFDTIALQYNLFNSSNTIKGIYEYTIPLEELLFSGLKEGKTKTVNELIDVLYHISEIKPEHPQIQESLQRDVLTHLQNNTGTHHMIIRICNFKCKISPELRLIVRNCIIDNIIDYTVSDISMMFLNPLFVNDQEFKSVIIAELHKRRISKLNMNFQRFERIINFLMSCNANSSELWPPFENFINNAMEENLVSEHFLMKIMHWIIGNNIESEYTEKLFMERILEKGRISYHHSRDLMNLVVIIGNRKSLRTNEILKIADDKLFSFSHYADYFEMAKSLYFLSRINRISFETADLLIKRILDKDNTNATTSDFSLVCYAAVMLSNLEFCRKSISIAKMALNYSDMGEGDIAHIGDLFNNHGRPHAQPFPATIRIAWMMAFMDIEDMRIFNTRLYEHIQKELVRYQWTERCSSQSPLFMDPTHAYLMMQILAIKNPNRAANVEFLEKISEDMQKYAVNYDHNEVNEETAEFCKEIGEVAGTCNYEVEIQEKLVFGNYLPLRIQGKVVVPYTKDHYRYQSEGYYNQQEYHFILGIYKLRIKMLEALGVRFIEIQQGDWKNKTLEEKQAYLKNAIDK